MEQSPSPSSLVRPSSLVFKGKRLIKRAASWAMTTSTAQLMALTTTLLSPGWVRPIPHTAAPFLPSLSSPAVSQTQASFSTACSPVRNSLLTPTRSPVFSSTGPHWSFTVCFSYSVLSSCNCLFPGYRYLPDRLPSAALEQDLCLPRPFHSLR